MHMRLVDIQCLPTLDHTLFFFFFGIQQNVTRPDSRNIYSNWYGLIMRDPYVRACARSMHTVRKWWLVSIVRTPELPIIAFQPDV